MAVLSIVNCSVSYGQKEILNNISLECSTTNIIGLYGKNGAGKSTLLQHVFKNSENNSKTVVLQYDSSKWVRPIAFLPQFSFIPKKLKVRDAIQLYYQSSMFQDQLFYNKTISKISHKLIGELSLGQLKYFEALMILYLPVPFVLLDEPFSMLDPFQKDEIKQLIQTISQSKGFLITDHYYNDVFEIATKNYVIENKNIKTIKQKEDLVTYNYLTQNSI